MKLSVISMYRKSFNVENFINLTGAVYREKRKLEITSLSRFLFAFFHIDLIIHNSIALLNLSSLTAVVHFTLICVYIYCKVWNFVILKRFLVFLKFLIRKNQKSFNKAKKSIKIQNVSKFKSVHALAYTVELISFAIINLCY